MSDEVGTSGNWNLPNVLTGIRILIVPFYGVALLQDGGDSVLWRTVAAVLFFVAMVTDKIDGDIARSRGLVTNFGKIADPIADKAMTGMAFIGLSIVGDIWWWVTIVVLLREWSVTLLRLSILKRVVVAAAYSGKVKTVLQAVALTGLCAAAASADRASRPGRSGALLRLRGDPGRSGRDDDVVRLRVLPRRLAPAGHAPRHLTFTPTSWARSGCASGVVPTRVTAVTPRRSRRVPALGSRLSERFLHPMPHDTRALIRRALAGTAGLAVAAAGLAGISPAHANTSGPGLVINEAYGGGGNSGALYKNDFVELRNTTDHAVSLGGLSVQYRSATGTGAPSGGNVAALPSVDLPAGGTFLVSGVAGSRRHPGPAHARPDQHAQHGRHSRSGLHRRPGRAARPRYATPSPAPTSSTSSAGARPRPASRAPLRLPAPATPSP